MSEAVRVEGLSKVYEGGVRALKGVSLDVGVGEFVGVMGPSGSGKSTLLHIIAGLEKPTEGKVWVFGQDITQMKEDELSALRQKNIGFVFQFYYLMEDFSAYENLLIIGRLARIKDAEKKAREILEFLGLGHRLRHKPSELSG
ncbi:MAG: ATP-binding cassette domain-containing protein, partial [Aquificota bacterium]